MTELLKNYFERKKKQIVEERKMRSNNGSIQMRSQKDENETI